MGIGRVLGAAAPIAAGYFAGPAGFAGLTGTGAAIAAGAATGAGIAALSGEDILGGAVTGGLGGMSGGAMGTAAGKTAAETGLQTTAEANKAAISTALGSSTPPTAAAGTFNPALTQSTGLPQLTSNAGAYAGPASMMSQPGVLSKGAMTGQAVAGGGGYNPSAFGRGIDAAKASIKEPGKFVENLGGGSKAKGAARLGLTSLGIASDAGAFDPDMPAYEDDPRNKYDPRRRLDLDNINTGLTLNRDTGLRLLAEGGTVRDRSYYGIEPKYEQRQTMYGLGPQPGPVRVPVRGFVDVGGKFKADPKGDITDMEYEEKFKYVTEGTTAEQNQAGGDMDSINKAAGSGQPNAGAVAALAKGFAKQQTEGPTKSQTLGLESLEGGGYLETGGKIGDGMADEIPASIDGMQEARLSDGEFVIPADVVSHLGNGSSDAGAKRLYEMMDKVRMARTGTKNQGKEIQPERYMPR